GAGYEFPPVDPPDEPAAAFVPGLPLGAPKPPDVSHARVPEATPPPATPFGSPFAVPAEQPQIFGVPGLEMPEPGWQWEPPESGDEKPKEP
ncbi:MAG: hypothetical protein M3R35_06705, partial [Candidatus Eremiobacteraeota bacterium]|nr:hypothetical protein [Candidatus Eremiobacteraeota bacterium]